MQRTRCADDFAAIRARMQELQHERERAARKLSDEAFGSSGQRAIRHDPPGNQAGREELFRPPRRLG
jgi:hypothetical protein